MKLAIRTRNIELTDELRDRVSRRLQLSLDAFDDHIEDGFVYLMDLNGPKGGVDKLCQITVRARGVGELAIRETGTSLHVALNRAARRMKYRLSEALRASDATARDSIRTVHEAA